MTNVQACLQGGTKLAAVADGDEEGDEEDTAAASSSGTGSKPSPSAAAVAAAAAASSKAAPGGAASKSKFQDFNEKWLEETEEMAADFVNTPAMEHLKAGSFGT